MPSLCFLQKSFIMLATGAFLLRTPPPPPPPTTTSTTIMTTCFQSCLDFVISGPKFFPQKVQMKQLDRIKNKLIFFSHLNFFLTSYFFCWTTKTSGIELSKKIPASIHKLFLSLAIYRKPTISVRQ